MSNPSIEKIWISDRLSNVPEMNAGCWNLGGHHIPLHGRLITMASTINYVLRTPESKNDATIASSIKPGWPTIDSHKRDEWNKYIYPHVNTTISPEEMLNKLYPAHATSPSLAAVPKMTKTKENPTSTYCTYLNELSAEFHHSSCSYS